jgi:hypothetical protein
VLRIHSIISGLASSQPLHTNKVKLADGGGPTWANQASHAKLDDLGDSKLLIYEVRLRGRQH